MLLWYGEMQWRPPRPVRHGRLLRRLRLWQRPRIRGPPRRPQPGARPGPCPPNPVCTGHPERPAAYPGRAGRQAVPGGAVAGSSAARAGPHAAGAAAPVVRGAAGAHPEVSGEIGAVGAARAAAVEDPRAQSAARILADDLRSRRRRLAVLLQDVSASQKGHSTSLSETSSAGSGIHPGSQPCASRRPRGCAARCNG